MNKKQYDLIFRIDEQILRPFFIEAMIKGGYGDVNFVIIHEPANPTFEMYLSKRDQKKTATIGMSLYLNKLKMKTLFKSGLIISSQIDKIISKNPFQDLNKKSTEEIEIVFKRFYSNFLEFLKIYCLTEFIYSQEADKTIRNFVFSKIKNQQEANHAFGIMLSTSKKEKINRERKRFFKLLNSEKEIETLCEAVRNMGTKKLIFRSVLNQCFIFLEAILEEIGRRLYLSPKQIKSCLYDEIFDLIKNKKADIDQIIQRANKRSQFFAVVKRKGHWVFYEGLRAKKIISFVKLEIPKIIHEFGGDIASEGLAQGVVKIIPVGVGREKLALMNKKINEMKTGEILVAETTGPEMVLACKKASAIIAEEGGINSHAAIISREFGIPCIVNTKIATQILKDGDLIEVDANKGIVKILKKK